MIRLLPHYQLCYSQNRGFIHRKYEVKVEVNVGFLRLGDSDLVILLP